MGRFSKKVKRSIERNDPRRRAFVKQIHAEAIQAGLSGKRLAKAIEMAWKEPIPDEPAEAEPAAPTTEPRMYFWPDGMWRPEAPPES